MATMSFTVAPCLRCSRIGCAPRVFCSRRRRATTRIDRYTPGFTALLETYPRCTVGGCRALCLRRWQPRRRVFREGTPRPRLRGQAAQHVRILVRIVRIEDADRIHESARAFRDLQNLGQVMPAGIVAPIADYDEYFLVVDAGLQSLLPRATARRAPSCRRPGFWRSPVRVLPSRP